MLVLHHLNNSRSQRILWLLEELGVEYQLQKYQRDPVTNLAPESLKSVHPLGRAPVLCCPQGDLAESAAIIDYLVDAFAVQDLAPPQDGVALQQYRFWMHFAEGSLMPAMVASMVLSKAREKASPFFIKPIVNKMVQGIMQAYYGPNLKQSLDYVERHLEQHDWFVDNRLTGADVQMSFPLEALVARRQASDYPAITAYVRRIHQRPAYQQALVQGGPYAYA